MKNGELYFWQRKRRTEKEGEENLWRTRIYFVEEKNNREGKRGNEKENVTLAGQTNDNRQGKIGLLSQWTVEG